MTELRNTSHIYFQYGAKFLAHMIRKTEGWAA